MYSITTMTNLEESPGASRSPRIKKIAALCGRLMEAALENAPNNWSGEFAGPPAEGQAPSQPVAAELEVPLTETSAMIDRTHPE